MTLEEASNTWDNYDQEQAQAIMEDDWADVEVAGAEKDYDEELDEYWTEPKELLKSGMTDEELEHYDESQAESKKLFNEFLDEGGTTDTELSETNGAVWMAFMGHIPHTEIEYLKTEMGKLKAPYVMAAETAGYEHFHFLAKITTRQYHNFSKKVFKDKYGLRGKWYKTADGMNHPRQYGKVKKEIRDLSKMMSYTLKDQNFSTNMKTKDIETILKKKIEECENTKDREIKEKMLIFVDKYLHERFIIDKNKPMQRHQKYIRIIIIKFLIQNKCSVIRSCIDRLYYFYVINTGLEAFKLNEYAIYDELYDQLYS